MTGRASVKRWKLKNPERVRELNRRSNERRVKRRHALATRPMPDKCEVCKRPCEVLDFDHDHRFGHFRGWLCRRCNLVLGKVYDSAGLLRSLAAYLETDIAKLTTAQRKAEPASDFGLPGSRSYPMPDKSHAGNAKARASQQAARGGITPAQKAQIDTKADRILGGKV